METDKTTLNDLSVFNADEENSLFFKLDRTLSTGGREQLYHYFSTPLTSVAAIEGVQQTLKYIITHRSKWPGIISNGTIMMVEKLYEATIDQVPSNPTAMDAYMYKIFHGPDFSLVKYSATHCFDFIKGMQQMVSVFLQNDAPGPLKALLEEAKKIIDKEQFRIIEKNSTVSVLSNADLLHIAGFIRYHYKVNMLQLIHIYSRLDAWYGMAMAVDQLKLVFPRFIQSDRPVLKSKGLYHLLLKNPVPYDLEMNPEANFLFLTGANMAGKSTFIKSTGAAVFLAHIGMGVPAQDMELSLFDGLLSNINVVDNLIKGESYFYNEVQRIKATITKVNNGKKWLILIDELFKGTNVQDAMKCSSAVIEGLLKINNSLFILSTHLYEIGEDLKKYPNISFNYFETNVTDDQLQFSYQLKKGISNDRLGYLILKREGVVKMLEGL
jgi:DNA mismatch repair ATPase MutS